MSTRNPGKTAQKRIHQQRDQSDDDEERQESEDEAPEQKKQKKQKKTTEPVTDDKVDLLVGTWDTAKQNSSKDIPVYAYLNDNQRVRFRYHKEDQYALEITIPTAPIYRSIQFKRSISDRMKPDGVKIIKDLLLAQNGSGSVVDPNEVHANEAETNEEEHLSEAEDEISTSELSANAEKQGEIKASSEHSLAILFESLKTVGDIVKKLVSDQNESIEALRLEIEGIKQGEN
ncbi:uncharacterized protein LY89DRAFT_663642 [Mollisia scopiformis]|uniref:Uncharacterized protein n=1 Tax=Mollisia scopiformis TaxID=149040 RepID=A0A194XSK5_MOLSC|nr:uncharacterized protein LY89DRAFT_663642 [Mollisia scopiformis]KUJ23178.1 hypothetical protein LY89DRAFT_663642 [Mollisia scopiformis]